MWVIIGGWQGSKRPPPELVQIRISYDLNLSSFLSLMVSNLSHRSRVLFLSAKCGSVRVVQLCCLLFSSKSSVLKCYLSSSGSTGYRPKLAVSTVTAPPGCPHATVSALCCLARSGWCGRVLSAIAAHRRSIEGLIAADGNAMLELLDASSGANSAVLVPSPKSGAKGGRTPNVGRCQAIGLSLSLSSLPLSRSSTAATRHE